MADAYPLAALMSVRHFREEAAQRDLAHANDAAKSAALERDAKKEELAECIAFNREETERRYAALIGTRVSMEELDKFHFGLAVLKGNERAKQQAAEEAEAALARAQAAVKTAAAAAKAARKNALKIEKHRSIWLEAAKKEAERAEDRELEEFRPTGRLGASAEEAGF